jgi:hypothetical protein
MKTLEECINYMSSKPYFSQFVYNTVCGDICINENTHFRNINCSIVDVFIWDKTPEGGNYWYKIDKELIDAKCIPDACYTDVKNKIIEMYPKYKYPELYI